MENRNEMEIDLLGLLLHLKTKIWIIVLATLISGIGGYLGTKLSSTPTYTATTQVYVHQMNQDGVTSSDLTASIQIRRDCAVIIKGESVTREVVKRLGLPMSPQALGGMISVTSDADTRILNLSYTDTDPQRAATIINCVREVAAEKTKELMIVDVLKTIYEAEVPTAQVTTNIRRNTIAFAAIGCVVMTILIIVIFLLDDTIRTEDDVDGFLGLSTLAAIPASTELRVNRGSRVRKIRNATKTAKPSQKGKV